MSSHLGPVFTQASSGLIPGPISFQTIISPAQLTGNTDDWNPAGLSNAGIVRVSMDSNHELRGLAGGADGRILVLENVSTTINITIIDEATTSTAANRFAVPGGDGLGGSFSLTAKNSLLLVYDGTTLRWRPVSWAPGVAVTPAALGTAAVGTSPFYSRADHVHPSEGVVSSTYVPTLTQSGAVTKTTTYAHYIQIGKLVFVWIQLAITGSGTTNNALRIGLPVTAVSTSSDVIGTGIFTDASPATTYMAVAEMATTSAFALTRTDTNPIGSIGVDPNIAVASGDAAYAMVIYEAA